MLLEIGPQVLVLRRQLQRLAEMRGIFIPVETGFVGRHFEQHAARSTEIDRSEIVTVDHRCHLVARIHQRFADFELRGTVLDGEGHVMYRTGAQPGE